MKIHKDFEYFYSLSSLVTDALLHLLCHVAASPRHVPANKRNEILVRFLKLKLKEKRYANVKKDIKLMIRVGRDKHANLEHKLYDLHDRASRTKVGGVERLYQLLSALQEEKGIASSLFEEGEKTQPGVVYMLEEHIEHGFDHSNDQVAPISLLYQAPDAQELASWIDDQHHFSAEIKEWNADSHQIHIVLHPQASMSPNVEAT
ncbi:DUF2913 family protein [Vibrio coralliilyticus]|uniref:DUF2913 domain-containing protein n=1 Tax=Vibrio coralliilyticus TaxID=190893 RepID=A0AAN0SKZ1_9VIBR|nr:MULTISPECIES: DUF2913 family protein [Vibrio]AIS58324.1 hypothetical protein JV59_25190 [Vibrio coralliilyticus]AIW22920.1 hypothetical protein IX92_28220 [Vibrio coralliilyticus]AXN34584.1 DUF2913 family protein [Vibrio coralliilyticus]KPH24960.1 hypothetical protein ADU60_15775 [Vibrio coralliilyticus]MCC2524190.1 DUF2913 family protein [Vibrio coralliilyticus]